MCVCVSASQGNEHEVEDLQDRHTGGGCCRVFVGHSLPGVAKKQSVSPEFTATEQCAAGEVMRPNATGGL